MARNVVVIPTYNERDNIGEVVDGVFAAGADCDVLVVDDNSPDGTGATVDGLRATRPGLRVLHRPRRLGIGSAYIDGFRHVLELGYGHVFSMDADLSHDPRYLPDLLTAARVYDVVVGSRYLMGVSVVNWPLWRLALSLAANAYARRVTGLPVRDCTSGFQCFRADVLHRIPLDVIRTNGYSFLIELKYRAVKAGFRVGEVPIVFVQRLRGASKITRREIYASVFTVWKLRLGLYRR
jgi:dolichol-phosphate mannosyltransferase